MPEAFGDGGDFVRLPDGQEVLYETLSEEQKDTESYDSLGTPIPAQKLRDRLELAIVATKHRYERIYPGEDPSRMVKSLEDFVALAERKEREQDGKPCYVYASY